MSSSPGAPSASVPLGPRLLFGATQGAIGGAVLGAILGVIVASVQPKRVVGLDAAVLPIRTRRLWADSHMLQLTTEVLRHMDPRCTGPISTMIGRRAAGDGTLSEHARQTGCREPSLRPCCARSKKLATAPTASFPSRARSCPARDDIVHNICMDQPEGSIAALYVVFFVNL